MIRFATDTLKLEDGEPALRSCWECNGAHEHLRDKNFLHVCFECGRYWILGRYLDSFDSEKAMLDWLDAIPWAVGTSSQSINLFPDSGESRG